MSLSQIGNWLFDSSPGSPSFWYLILVVGFGLLFGGSLLAYSFRRTLFPGHSLHVQLTRRITTSGMVLGGTGLVFLLARYLGAGAFQMRVFLVLTVLTTLSLVVYLLWFRWRRYPSLLVAHEATKVRERFIRPQSHSARRREKKARR